MWLIILIYWAHELIGLLQFIKQIMVKDLELACMRVVKANALANN